MEETVESSESAYGANPFATMDPEMARNPQPVFKVLRADTPVMRIDMPTGPGVVLTRIERRQFARGDPRQ